MLRNVCCYDFPGNGFSLENLLAVSPAITADCNQLNRACNLKDVRCQSVDYEIRLKPLRTRTAGTDDITIDRVWTNSGVFQEFPANLYGSDFRSDREILSYYVRSALLRPLVEGFAP